MFLYLAISRKTSSSEILVNTFFSFCFLFSLPSASRNSRVVCSIVNIVYPFRIGTQTNGKQLFTLFPRLLKREKGNITFMLAFGFAVAFSHFRGLSAAMLTGTNQSTNIRKLSSFAALPSCQGTGRFAAAVVRSVCCFPFVAL